MWHVHLAEILIFHKISPWIDPENFSGKFTAQVRLRREQRGGLPQAARRCRTEVRRTASGPTPRVAFHAAAAAAAAACLLPICRCSSRQHMQIPYVTKNVSPITAVFFIIGIFPSKSLRFHPRLPQST
jgi:hypothetical protein